MDDSDTSSLSSVAPDEEVQKLAPIFIKAKKATKLVAPPPKATPPRPKREPSPPHEDVFADNPDIAFIVMFRSRFSAAFSPKLAHLGPQDVERAVFDTVPGPQADALLCALLGLVLNRKKPVEQGHYGRALEEAVQSHKSQWPQKWQGKSPLSGGQDFRTMTPEDRLYLLRTLIMWSLTSSEEVSAIIRNGYKQNRHNDDENQPLSVQPWGRDGDKRRYFLIEGQDDTSFRVYREGQRTLKNVQWYSMAGEIEDIKVLAAKLDKEDGSQAARTLGARMMAAIPRFEATEEKRKRREYRQMRRAQFVKPEPGFSLYEGRTRGKRMRYTYDDDDQSLSDTTSARRSGRHSERDTPVDNGPVTTLSGRQVKPRRGGEYGASLLSGQSNIYGTPDYDDGTDGSEIIAARPTRNAVNGNGKRQLADDYNDEMSDDEDEPSGEEWDSEANEQDDYDMPDADDEDEDIEDAELDELGDRVPRSLVVKLRVSGGQNDLDVAKPDTLETSRMAIPEYNEAKHNGVDRASPVQEATQHEGPEPHALKQQLANDKAFTKPTHDTPTYVNPVSAQQPLSGYPTPASLPLTQFNAPTEVTTSAWQHNEPRHQSVTATFVPQAQ